MVSLIEENNLALYSKISGTDILSKACDANARLYELNKLKILSSIVLSILVHIEQLRNKNMYCNSSLKSIKL